MHATRNCSSFLSLAAMALLFVSIAGMAQAPTGRIHGRVTDPTGIPRGNGTVSLSTDGGRTLRYSFPVSSTGDFIGDGIAPDTYTVVFRLHDTPEGQLVDHIDKVKIAAGEDVYQNVDMSRQAYIDRMTPEQKKALQEYINKNTQIMKNNQAIRNLNADLNDARAANHDKKYDVAEALMLRDTGVKPDGELLWYELGVAQLGLMKWDAADASFKKAVDFSLASKKPSPELIGGAYAAEGEADARNNKPTIAINEYDLAAQTNPVKAGLYYSNEAVVFFNVGNTDAQAASADKAIRADPSNPLPYYLKGQALAGKTTINSRTGAYTLPPGCAEAYQKYLELAPNGPYSAQSRAFLQAVQSKDPARFNANAPAAGQGNLKSKEEAQQRADAQQQDGLRQRQQQAQNAAPPTPTSQTPAPANPPVARPAAPAISQSSAAKPATAANQPPAAVSKPGSTEPAKSRTLSSQAVLSLLQQGLSPKRVTTLVNERGVTFSLTAPLEKQLRSAGADDALLLAVATHKKSQ